MVNNDIFICFPQDVRTFEIKLTDVLKIHSYGWPKTMEYHFSFCFTLTHTHACKYAHPVCVSKCKVGMLT